MKRLWIEFQPVFKQSISGQKNRYVINFTLVDIHMENADNFVEIIFVIANVIFHYLSRKQEADK